MTDYSPAETYPVYSTMYLQMIKSFEVVPQKGSTENAVATSTYEHRFPAFLMQLTSS